MKKFLSLMLVLMMLMSLSSVSSYASDDDFDDTSVESSHSDSDDDSDEDESDDSGMDSNDDIHDEEDDSDNRVGPVREKMMSGSGTGMGAGKATFQEFTLTTKAGREMLREKREIMKSEIEANRDEAEENRENFRIANGTHIKEAKLNLTEAQKVSLSDLHFSHKKEMETLRQELKNSTTQEEREMIYDEMKELTESHYIELADIMGEDAEKLIDERKAVWEKNEILRDENRAMRNEYKEVKRTTVEKYRKAFVSKLGNSLDKIPAEKLPQIVERINTMMEKKGTSETMMAALTAILELVEEKMEGDDVESDVLDVVESLLQ